MVSESEIWHEASKMFWAEDGMEGGQIGLN